MDALEVLAEGVFEIAGASKGPDDGAATAEDAPDVEGTSPAAGASSRDVAARGSATGMLLSPFSAAMVAAKASFVLPFFTGCGFGFCLRGDAGIGTERSRGFSLTSSDILYSTV